MLFARYRGVLRHLKRKMIRDNNIEGAQAIEQILSDREKLAAFAEEATAAYAVAQGIEVYAAGPAGRPFLEFLQGLIDQQAFREFFEWVLEHSDEILKLIMTIIGMF